MSNLTNHPSIEAMRTSVMQATGILDEISGIENSIHELHNLKQAILQKADESDSSKLSDVTARLELAEVRLNKAKAQRDAHFDEIWSVYRNSYVVKSATTEERSKYLDRLIPKISDSLIKLNIDVENINLWNIASANNIYRRLEGAGSVFEWTERERPNQLETLISHCKQRIEAAERFDTIMNGGK